MLTVGIFFDIISILRIERSVKNGKYKYEYQNGFGSEKTS